MSEPAVVIAGGTESEVSAFGSLRIVLPLGGAYWSVVDEEYRLVVVADVVPA